MARGHEIIAHCKSQHTEQNRIGNAPGTIRLLPSGAVGIRFFVREAEEMKRGWFLPCHFTCPPRTAGLRRMERQTVFLQYRKLAER
jgi:hypothetical protein